LAAVHPRQLAFALPHAESFSRDDFLEGPGNAAAVELIDRWPDWPGRVVMLVGEAGAGKSHLAAIWAENAGARLVAARALTAAAVPGALATGALVVEDVAVAGLDERALFHLLNLARQDEVDVLMTARTPPAGWALELPDLLSRLRAVPIVTLAAPDDALLRSLIVKLCLDRQRRQPNRALLCRSAQGSGAAGRGGIAPATAGHTRAGCGTLPLPVGLTPRKGGPSCHRNVMGGGDGAPLINNASLNGAPPTSADLSWTPRKPLF
jgi:chromosomal replication initiation ATPase DnaA